MTRTDLPEDPTAFRPMRVIASRDLPVGYELEPISRRMTLDKSRIYWGWPGFRNRHTDYPQARLTGLREPNIGGGQSAELIGSLFMRFFGEGFLGGSLSFRFVGFVSIDDVITAKAVITEKRIEGERMRILLDAWAENQRGEKVVLAKVSGLAP